MEKPVVIKNLGQQMVGMLHLPEGEGPFPAVALYHGFTGTKVEPHRIFVKMARRLNALGIAAVRFDLWARETVRRFADMTVSGEISDGIKILDYLTELEAVDSQRLGVLGLSMGGAVAACVAGRDDRVKSVALWSAVADFALFAQNKEALAKAKEQGYADVGGNVLNYEFYEDASKHDPAAAIAKFAGPVLIVHGSEDPTVPVSHADIFEQAISGQKEKVILLGADHTYNRRDWEEKCWKEPPNGSKGLSVS